METCLKPLHLSGDRCVIRLGKPFHNFDVILRYSTEIGKLTDSRPISDGFPIAFRYIGSFRILDSLPISDSCRISIGKPKRLRIDFSQRFYAGTERTMSPSEVHHHGPRNRWSSFHMWQARAIDGS